MALGFFVTAMIALGLMGSIALDTAGFVAFDFGATFFATAFFMGVDFLAAVFFFEAAGLVVFLTFLRTNFFVAVFFAFGAVFFLVVIFFFVVGILSSFV